MDQRIFYGENSSGRMYRHVRPPSPDERQERLQAETSRNPDILLYVRQLPAMVSGPPVAPTDPHTSWRATAYIFNVSKAVIPPMVDLKAPRVGRMFTWHARAHVSQATLNVALLPACKGNPLVPPYPGIPPDHIYDPCNPISCFSDGKLARWDPRSYPQLYNERRPWLPYHWGPFVIPPPKDYDRPADTHLHWSWSDVKHVEYLPATAFYRWYWPGHPWRGGFFIRQLLDQLFVRRLTAENQVLRNLHMRDKAGMPPLATSAYDLPWYDTLEWTDTLKWASWGEGRDSIARTCLYVAELDAFAEWIDRATTRYSLPSATRSRMADYKRYMGTWSDTIPCCHDWTALYLDGVPVYMALAILTNEDTENPLQEGAPEADEQYRENAYDAIHGFCNPKAITPAYIFTSLETLNNEYFSPPQLLLPTPPKDIIDDPALAICWRKNWTSYIYLNSTVPQVDSSNPQFNQPEEFWVDSRLLAPFLPPGEHVLTTEESPHPFFFVCPQAKSRAIMRYKEMYNSSLDIWWFETVKGRWPLDIAKKMAYRFIYPAHAIVIYSEHHFPGMNQLFCRVSKQPPQSIVPSARSRRYYYTFSSSKEDVEATGYLWEYRKEYVGDDGVIHSGEDLKDATEDEPEVGDGPLPHSLDVDTDANADLDAEGYAHAEDLEFDHDPIAQREPQDVIAELTHQRSVLQREVEHRVFNPVKGVDLRCEQVTHWEVPGSKSCLIWPIRIANLHGDVKPAAVVDMLVQTCKIRRVDILIICPYQEIDTTQTIDVGLRHSEDALWAYCLLHGVQVDERYLEVYPIRGIKGKAQVLDVSNWKCCEPDVRVSRWAQLFWCTEAHPDPADIFGEQVAKFGFSANNEGVENNIVGDFNDFVASLPSLLGVQVNPLTIQMADRHLTMSTLVASNEVSMYTALEGALVWDATSTAQLPTSHHVAGMSQQRQNNYPSSSNSQSTRPPARRGQPMDHDDEGSLHAGESYKKKKRHQHQAKRTREETDPAVQKSSSASERRSRLETLKYKAKVLSSSCKFKLPPFIPPAPKDVVTGSYMVALFTAWWDWLDECHHTLDEKRFQGHNFDWSTMDDVFGHLQKLQGLYGQDHKLCLSALQKRPHWTPRQHSE